MTTPTGIYLPTAPGPTGPIPTGPTHVTGAPIQAEPAWEKSLQGTQRDAYAALTALFNSYGLSSLAPKIFEYIKQGYGSDTISLLLQQTPEYKQRFAGNEARLKAGLPVLSPAQYLATEDSYRQVLQAAGLPKGFYDSPSDFTNWIAGDVSATELKNRADEATAVVNGNPEVRDAMKQLYGVSDGDIAAYFLDPAKAEPILRKQEQAAEIAAAGLQRGFGVSQYAEQFAAQGITTAQAQQGYGIIAQEYQPMQELAALYGTTWSQGEAELSVFSPGTVGGAGGTNAQQPGAESASQKQRRLASQERAAFATASGGAAPGSLGQPLGGAA